MRVICRDRQERSKNASAPEGRAVNSVAADIDRILSMKSLGDLVTLEKQIVAKLASNEPIDVDYWNQLLRSLRIWKAKASLKQVYTSVIKSRLEILHKQQREDAETVKRKLEAVLGAGPIPVIEEGSRANALVAPRARESITYSREMDPEPLLKIRFEDRVLENLDEKDFLRKIVSYVSYLMQTLTFTCPIESTITLQVFTFHYCRFTRIVKRRMVIGNYHM